MKAEACSIFLVLLLICALSCFPISSSEYPSRDSSSPYVLHYQLIQRKIFVSITWSLYVFYKSQPHAIYGLSDYWRFITPTAVEPIANILMRLSQDEEEFANMVLSVVHQIPYSRSGLKYPVETLLENNGDCGALSILAASLMAAGSLDVALIYYELPNASHMAVGVSLAKTPTRLKANFKPRGYLCNGKRYWVAECTGSGWHVGEERDDLKGAPVKLIPINRFGEAPAKVAASLDDPPMQSSISLNVPPQAIQINGSIFTFTVLGRIAPAVIADVVLYMSRDASSWALLGKARTNISGIYNLSCRLSAPGIYYIVAGWSGCNGLSGSDSPTLIILTGPRPLIQFQGPLFNYTFLRWGLSEWELQAARGMDTYILLDMMYTGIMIDAEFMILRGEQPPLDYETLENLQMIRLPEDFDMQVRDQLALILNVHNKSVSLKGLSIHDIKTLPAEVKIHNLTHLIAIGRPYRLTIEEHLPLDDLEGMAIFGLYGPALESTITLDGAVHVILLASIRNSLMVLRAPSFSRTPTPTMQVETHHQENPLSTPPIWPAIIAFSATFLAAWIIKRKRSKKTRYKIKAAHNCYHLARITLRNSCALTCC